MKIHASMSPGGGGDRSEGLGRPLAGFRRGWRPPAFARAGMARAGAVKAVDGAL
jgi:hypothetical protein